MPRESQYQPAGNPLQTGRLPDTRPVLAFPYQPLTAKAEHRLVRRMVTFLICLAPVGALAELFRVSAHAGQLGANAILAGVGVYLIVGLLKGNTTAGLNEALIGLALALVYFNWPPPLTAHLMVFAGSMSLLTWLFGSHWIAFCTASPVARQRAGSLQETWGGFLGLAAAIPCALFFAAGLLGFSQFCWMVLAVPVVQVSLLFLALDGEWDLSAAWSALTSWLTYNPTDDDVPGILQSPAGRWPQRIAVTAGCVLLAAVTLVRVLLDVPGLSPISVAAAVLVPAPFVLAAPVLLLLPLLVNAAQYRRDRVVAEDWKSITAELTESATDAASTCAFVGRLHCDGSPALVPFSVYGQHAHFLGDSGSGKTARGISPTIEQLIAQGKCSLVALDLKGDSHELFAALMAGVEAARCRTAKPIPVKFFTNKMGLPSFAFNPLAQPCYQSFTPYIKTDIQCGALGLTYGADYGEGFYSSANSAVLYQTIKQYPDVSTYRELAERVGYVVANAKKSELHPEIRKSGVHVQTVLDRLGSCEALNVSPTSGHPAEVVAQAIDLAQVFTEPQVLYFQLSSMLGPSSAPEIARLVSYSLLAAATQTKRRCQVYLVIDEFQRMVAQNLEYMLQLARSMGVGIILANQTMEDLRTSRANLIPTIETNCRYRHWFSVSAMEDRQRLIESSGQTVEVEVTRGFSRSDRGSSTTVTYSKRVVPRLTENDILLASDDPNRSICKISRGEGYAQYGGMPIVLVSDYHIGKEEYDNRVSMPWPQNVPGAFVPQTTPPDSSAGSPASRPPVSPRPSSQLGPTITTEVIGGAPTAPATAGAGVGLGAGAATAAEALFEAVQTPAKQHHSRRRRTTT